MAWGWRRGWRGPWPGNGPFSYLPPWERPGWRCGPGYWWIATQQSNQAPQSVPQFPATPAPTDIYTRVNEIERTIDGMKTELQEIRKLLQNYKKE